MKAFLQGALAAAITISAVMGTSGSAVANGFGENRPWQFADPSDRNARAATLDLIERKQGGFYDGFDTNNFNENFNCTGSAPNALANQNTQVADATTSSPDTGSTANTDSSATGNQSEHYASNSPNAATGAPLNGPARQNNQANSGQVNSAASSSVDNTVGDIDASGGQSNQALNSDQANSGTVTASADGGVGCNFYGPSGTTAVD